MKNTLQLFSPEIERENEGKFLDLYVLVLSTVTWSAEESRSRGFVIKRSAREPRFRFESRDSADRTSTSHFTEKGKNSAGE